MIGKRPSKKTRRKIGSKGSIGVSETKVEEDTPNAIEEGKTLGDELGVGEHQEDEIFQDLIKTLKKFSVNECHTF